MANSIIKDLEIMFGEFIEGYDAQCVISVEAAKKYPSPQDMQRSGDVFYLPQNYNAVVTTGLDISGANDTDVIQRMVPVTYRTPDNVRFSLDAKEMRDEDHKRNMGKAAALRLAGEVDKNLYAACAARAGIVVKTTSPLAWTDGAQAEALLLSRGYSADVRKMFMNPQDYKSVAADLGGKAYMGDWSKNAYERSQVPGIAGFKTFRTDNQSVLTAIGTVAATTVNGNQSFTPTAMTGDVPTDNRQMVLNVAGANIANIKAGDAFTIPNVNACHQIDKSDTGQLMTFRVLSVAGGGANLTITPPIITTGPYQNVTTQAANGVTLTFLNTASKPVNVFWNGDSVLLAHGKLAFPTGEGVQVMTATTKQGVPLIMSYAFNHLTGKTTCRFTTLYAVSVLDPEQVGIIIANQT